MNFYKQILVEFEQGLSESLTGYKIMHHDDGKLYSLAGGRYAGPLKKGFTLKMSGKGVWLSTNRNFVIDHYEGNADKEVLLILKFNKNDITSGDIKDKEPVITVPEATIIDYEILSDDVEEDSNDIYDGEDRIENPFPNVAKGRQYSIYMDSEEKIEPILMDMFLKRNPEFKDKNYAEKRWGLINSSPTKKIKHDDIVSTEDTLNRKHLNGLVDGTKKRENLPIVIKIGNKYFVQDGNHRIVSDWINNKGYSSVKVLGDHLLDT